jgi:hypothetical protein
MKELTRNALTCLFSASLCLSWLSHLGLRYECSIFVFFFADHFLCRANCQVFIWLGHRIIQILTGSSGCKQRWCWCYRTYGRSWFVRRGMLGNGHLMIAFALHFTKRIALLTLRRLRIEWLAFPVWSPFLLNLSSDGINSRTSENASGCRFLFSFTFLLNA